jgi:hypothetical protein
MIIHSAPLDLLYICAELMTGKSIPVLVGITRLPVGQGLAWISVAMGAVTGTCFSVLVARRTCTLSLLSFINRFLQLSFSLGLSVSLLLSLAKGVHVEHGVSLVVIPAFCVAIQGLPQRHSTALVAFLLCIGTFYVCTVTSVVDEGNEVLMKMKGNHAAASSSPVRRLSSQHAMLVTPPPPVALTLQEIVLRALQLFALGFYASIQHAPTQVYFDTHHCHPVPLQHRPVYASYHHSNLVTYSFFIGLVCSWVRVCAWSVVCFMQDNKLHLMLENDRPDSWDWVCCALYITTLLYSACWTATQLKEQVLPRFCIESEAAWIKILVCIFIPAVLFRQRFPDVMFYSTYTLTFVALLTAYATQKAGREEISKGKP